MKDRILGSTKNLDDPNWADPHTVFDQFQEAYGANQRRIIECNSEALRFYNELTELETQYE